MLFCLLANLAWAQRDSTQLNRTTRIKDLKTRLENKVSGNQTKIDTLKPVLPDTLKRKIPSLDSLSNPFGQISGKTDSLTSLITHPVDGVSGKIDSLSGLINKPVYRVSGKADSLVRRWDGQADKIQQNINAEQEKIQFRVDSISGKANEKIQSIQGKLQEGLTKKNKNPETDKLIEKLPGLSDQVNTRELPAVGLPEGKQHTGLPELEVPGTTTQLPAGKPGLSGSEIDTPAGRIPEIKAGLPELEKSIPGVENVNAILNPEINPDIPKSVPKVSDSLSVDDLKKIPGLNQEQLELIEQVSPYQKHLDSLTIQDALEMGANELEYLAEDIAGVKQIDAEMQKALALKAKQETLLQRYHDKKLLESDIVRKSKNIANDKLNQFSPEFTDAQGQIGKVKRFNPLVQSFKDMTTKRPNEMKGKPLRDRIIPGISLQAFNGNPLAIDVSPQVGYLVSSRWIAGIAGVYRFGLDKDYAYYIEGNGIWGMRTYTEFRAVRGLFLHGELEWLRATTRAYPVTLESGVGQMFSAYIGIGKQYEISRKLSGSIIALYRGTLEGQVPGASKFHLRLVFNYKTKKIKKPTLLK